ncbi:hypothetical protein [Kordiimonas sp.]|uniref:hypothetical protein n=1 Tax=Kordiimonas sp. TaxID=1970157 RepID=UPI003A8E5236
MKKVLITSVGSNVGGNFMLCLAHRRGEFYFIGTNLISETAFNYMCDEVHIVPRVADEAAFIAAHEKLIFDLKPDLVVAGRDQDVSALAKMKESDKFPHTIFLAPSQASARVSNDKYHSFEFAEKYNLPFAVSAVTIADAKALAEAAGYPLIAKPRMHGHASKDVFIVRNEAELIASVEAGGFVIQEMIGQKNAPEEYNPISECGVPLYYSYAITDQISCQALIGHDGEVLYGIASLNYYSFGRSHKYEPINDPKIIDVVKRYASALAEHGHFGPLNLQGKMDKNGDLKIYEINMRFTGATQGRTVLGWTEVEYAVDYLFSAKHPEIDLSIAGKYVAVREPYAYALSLEEMSELERTGSWYAQR